MNALLLLTLLALAALVLVAVANNAQLSRRRQRLALGQAWQRITALEKVLECLEQTLGNPVPAREVNEEIIFQLQKIPETPGNSKSLRGALQQARERGVELRNSSVHLQRVNYLRDNDNDVSRTQALLKLAAQVLRTRHQRNQLSAEALDKALQDLDWALLMVSSLSLVSRGQRAQSRGNLLSAKSFYRRAHELVQRSRHPEPRRDTLLRELEELLNDKRAALSPNLMPPQN